MSLPGHIMANYLIVVITTITLFPGISSHALAQVDGGRMLNETIYGAVSGLFSEAERQLISDYFQDTNRLEDEDNRDKKHKKRRVFGRNPVDRRRGAPHPAPIAYSFAPATGGGPG